ncbi:prepilin peptidase [Oscillibacter sp. MSJ-2]|uniref:Prepilin peptidase n=1 Tax=Dysosmobacter acutus TaxID=2841504 RepID=A0ABS6FB85_9FIRM|nr:A24 family peptidase [Dysosmobacter acutus]MBU5627540.1 prepilin peptidase [Dysosmobacter acutus]
MLHLTPAVTIYILTLSALFGLVSGSFANCCAWRMAHGESAAKGRSHCVACGHTLSPRELIPVISWVVQKGRCRHCGAPVSIRYPLTEGFTAIAFVLIVLRYDVTLNTLQFWILTAVLLTIALVDLETGYIPDSLVLGIALDFTVVTALRGGPFWSLWLKGVFNAAAVALPLLGLVLLMDRVLGRESMGGGDIKLFFAIGLFSHWSCNLFTLLLSCFLGIAFALIFRGVCTEDGEGAFPFGPAIAAAAFLSILAAEPAVQAYLSLF